MPWTPWDVMGGNEEWIMKSALCQGGGGANELAFIHGGADESNTRYVLRTHISPARGGRHGSKPMEMHPGVPPGVTYSGTTFSIPGGAYSSGTYPVVCYSDFPEYYNPYGCMDGHVAREDTLWHDSNIWHQKNVQSIFGAFAIGL